MTPRHKIHNPDGLHFITYTVVHWIDILTRPIYKDIIRDSLNYCQHQKGLQVHGYCIMSNHVHLLISRSGTPTLSDILRDHKKYTAKQLVREIQNNERESRKRWLLSLFQRSGQKNQNNQDY